MTREPDQGRKMSRARRMPATPLADLSAHASSCCSPPVLEGRMNHSRGTGKTVRRSPRRPWGSIAVTVLLALGSVSCCTRRGPNRGYPGPLPLPEHVSREYSRPKLLEFAVEEKVLESGSDYTVRRVTLKGLPCELTTPEGRARRHAITLDCYVPSADGASPLPTVLVLPILGGDYTVSRIFAAHFARRGLAALIVHRQKKCRRFNSIEDMDPVLRHTVLSHRQVIDWVETRPELDAERIGAFGVSMGAIKGALLAALDCRVKASVLGLAGGGLPHILTCSEEPGVAKMRRKFLEEHGLTLGELYERLKEQIVCDPINYAQYADARNVLLVVACLDECVPTVAGRRLRSRMGGPETVTILAGHYSAVVYLPYIRRRAVRFLKERLCPK